jgi:hypothetical protein
VKKLNIPTAEHRLSLAGREVVMSGQVVGVPIKDSEWLVMNTRGFESAEAASQFAHALRGAVDLSSIVTRLGVDSGVDRATSDVGQLVRERLEREQGTLVRGNVHGIDVFLDDPRVAIFDISATGTVHCAPDPFSVR